MKTTTLQDKIFNAGMIISLSSIGLFLLSILLGAILFVADQISFPDISIKEFFFWSAILLIFLVEVNKIIGAIVGFIRKGGK